MAHFNVEDAREEWESGECFGIGGFEDVSSNRLAARFRPSMTLTVNRS